MLPSLNTVKHAIVGLLTLGLVLHPSWAAAVRILTNNATAFYVVTNFSIPTSTTVTFETASCNPGTANPALHLLRFNGPQMTQVGFNDDFAGLGLNSKLTFTNTHTTQTNFMLIMRSVPGTPTGFCTVRLNGSNFQLGAPVGGTRIAASSLTFGAGNHIRTTHVPGGSVMPAIITFGPSMATVLAIGVNNAAGGAGDAILGGTESDFLVGTSRIRDGISFPLQPRTGNARILSNDVQTDPDGDGLGSSLESELQTCATLAGCGNNAVSGFDSDRDGLSDRDEVLGIAGVLQGGVDDLPLARWGANPNHKDVFVEVDYVNGLGGVLAPGQNPFLWIQQNPTLSMNGVFTGSLETWIARARQAYVVGPAAHLKNRDNVDGLNVHFDIGVAPGTLADESLFGDYGASSARRLEPDWVVTVTAQMTGSITVNINGSLQIDNVTGMSEFDIAWRIGVLAQQTMQPITVRSIVQDTGTGDTTIRIMAASDQVPFTAALTRPPGFQNAATDSRPVSPRIEYRSDEAQMSWKRRGKFHYAVISTIHHSGQAQGDTPAFESGMDMDWAQIVPSFVHELGHTVGLEHWGHFQWQNGSAECIPHYLSIMGYNALAQAFSTQSVASGLPTNPMSVVEESTFGAGFAYATYSGVPWNYAVTANRVDWNRDGVPAFAAAGSWASPVISFFDSGCRAHVQGLTQVNFGTTAISGTVDLTRFGLRLYAVWPESTSIRYRFANLGNISGTILNKGCTGSSDPDVVPPNPCLSWTPATTSGFLHAGGASYGGVSVKSSGNLMFVAWRRTSNNDLAISRYTINADGTLTHIVTDYFTTAGIRTLDTPELVELHDNASLGGLGVLYLADTGIFRLRRWNGIGWSNAEDLLVPGAGNPTIAGGTFGPAAKAWPDASFPWPDADRRTVAILPSAAGAIRVYVLDYATRRWTAVMNNLTAPAAGHPIPTTTAKPFLEYRLVRTPTGAPRADYGGHFLFGWGDSDGVGTRPHVRYSNYVNSSASLQGLFDLHFGDFLSNFWGYDQAGTSSSLYSDSLIGNVFGLSPRGVAGTTGAFFSPHADASPNHEYKVFSDFRVMEDMVCQELQDVGGIPCTTSGVFDVKD